MKLRFTPKVLVCFVVVFLSITHGKTVSAAEKRPNIIVFLGDDIGWKDYGCYGNDAVRTPNIDGLARRGMRFDNAFLTTSSCSPSRISILTGKFPHQTGAEDLHMPLPKDQKFVSSYLREKGYFAGHMRKTHYGPEGIKQFDWYSKSFAGFPDFLDQAGERPFFMWVGFRDAHRPYAPGAVTPPHDPARVTVPSYLADTPETRADLALYYDEISRMDENIGAMVLELKNRKRFRNTLVVFLGDNGAPFPRAKGTAYDAGIATPLVMCWPAKINRQEQTSGLTSVIDLAPTFLDAAGIPVPENMEGRSLMPVLRNSNVPGREFVFAERNWHNADEHIRCIRTAEFKLIRNAYLDKPFGHPADCSRSPSWLSLLNMKQQGKLTPLQATTFAAPRPEWELYDVKNDPDEAKNLAKSPKFASELARLQQTLEQWQTSTNDFPSSRRRRADNVNRVTGEKFTRVLGPLVETGEPEPLPPDKNK